MAIDYGYAFSNTKRDLSDILNTIIKGRIGLITLFSTGPAATNHKVEWLQDTLQARSLAVSANSSGTLTITASDIPCVGMVIQPDGKPDTFYVTTVTNSTTIAIALAGNNGGTLTAATAPIQNVSWTEFKDAVEKAGVTVLDLAPEFAEMRKTGDEPYLKTDTHWTPEGMYRASGILAKAIDGKDPEKAPDDDTEVENLGDIAAMLKLPDCEKYFEAEEVENPQFKMRTDRNSDVLLLGDSFANIFALESMKWGADSGLAEALGYQLGRPVDAILRNDAGAFATRQLLSNELKRGRDRLDGKKVVVWEFAIRELANGDWKILDMTLGEVPESTFLTVAEPRTVTATVLDMTDVPRPHSAPYSDHVMSLHLGDIDGGSEQALVYVVSMKNNVWTVAPKLRTGDTVKITLSPWSDYEKQYGTWNRSEFEDETLITQEPVYGELK